MKPTTQKRTTPLPWQCKRENDGLIAFRISGAGLILADVLFRGIIEHAPSKKTALANAELIVQAVNEHAGLKDALADIDLRATQARLASKIGKRKNRTDFLLGELERMQTVARAALARCAAPKLSPQTG